MNLKFAEIINALSEASISIAVFSDTILMNCDYEFFIQYCYRIVKLE